jgi:hypothetical protein
MQNNSMAFARVLPLYYMKLLVFGAIPVLLALADGSFWLIYGLIKGSDK